MTTGSLTGSTNFFEGFAVGQRIRHARGKTVEPLENVLITNLVLNSASAHFDEHVMKPSTFGKRVVFGGVTIALVIGLASQDTAENALAELGMTAIRLKSPVFHGDTLYAVTEVLEVMAADRADAGIVRFKHYGINQDDRIVFEGERMALIRRRPGAVAA